MNTAILNTTANPTANPNPTLNSNPNPTPTSVPTEPAHHACLLPYHFDVPSWLQRCLINQSDGTLTEYSIEDNQLICSAFSFAYQLHDGQCRRSGEPYIAHPVAVAGILRDMGGSSIMIAAGFLHDVVEDTAVEPEEIEERFGAEVRRLVEGVTKLSKLHFSSKTESQAENFRRMFLAMAEDIRVIVVKLADRLHNMRTLEFMPPEKQKQVALETKEIFSPLANRLGIWRLKWELEDLSFKYLDSESYRQMQELVVEKRADREARIRETTELLRNRLDLAGINWLDVSGRPKHLYSIYQKMERRQKEFSQIYDLTAMRIIVETNEECYRALAIVHDAFRPVPGRFKDYIGLPKPNHYQSLHTTVIGLSGKPLEIQIRTIAMHHISEYGIAAHWKYKQEGNSNEAKLNPEEYKFVWLRQLLDWQNDLKDAKEYLETVKGNLFDEDIYVFTPSGDVIALMQGATPVDFAYRIHTEVGNHCYGSRVNGRWSVLETELKNGDMVEIITQKSAKPSLDWINFVVTPSAKNRIRQWYKRFHRSENITRGRELLEKELGKKGLDNLLKSDPMQGVVERCNYHSVDDLLAGLGYGEITLNVVVNRIREAITAKLPEPEETIEKTIIELVNPSPTPKPDNKNFPIAGVEGILYHLAGCCNPVPGESIMGMVTKQRGITIHRQGCVNLEKVPGDRLIPVSWNPCATEGRAVTYPVNVQIEAIDRLGLLKDVLSHLMDHKINVRNVQVKTSLDRPAIIDLCIDIKDKAQLDRAFSQVRKMTDLLNIRRVTQGEDC